ncbi:MAG: hypothetical protein IT379_25130 [Deltaproteobacteria bacterium]|nr:hypothetical protein [Deltaproteobacteria bacterium]
MSAPSLDLRAALVAASALTATIAAVVTLVLVAPAVARAGDCPECTSAADCGREGSFCVLHDGPVGCGDRVQLCCPGQACAVGADGRPSCESAGTCTVVEGSAAPDAGPPLRDSGTPGADAGTPGADTGAPGADAGSGAGGTEDDGGCDCRAVPGGPMRDELAWGGLAAMIACGWLVRRRRARTPR